MIVVQEPRFDFGPVGGVDHHGPLCRRTTQIVNQYIVKNSAIFLANQAITNPARLQVPQATGDKLIKPFFAIWPCEAKTPHVADIEPTYFSPDRLVLLDDAGELDR